jgi:hypothetical protein
VFLAHLNSFVAQPNYVTTEAIFNVAIFRSDAQAVWKIDLLVIQVVGDDSGYVINK